MANVVEVRAIVRREMLDRVVHALKDAGVPRLTVTRVHAIGAGRVRRKATKGAGSSLPSIALPTPSVM